MVIGCQALAVPNVVSGAPGPWSSGWISNRIKKLTRIGLAANCTASDLVIVLGAATPDEAIILSLGRKQGAQPRLSGNSPGGPVEVLAEADPIPPNQLGTFNGAGCEEASLRGISACPWWLVLRYNPNPNANFAPAPTTDAVLELIGEIDDASSATFTWQITLLTADTAKSLAPNAWQASHSYDDGDVVIYTNGAYGLCTSPGVSGTVEPAPSYAADGFIDGTSSFTVTSPQGFANGIEWTNSTAGPVYTSSSPGLTPTNGFGPIANGAPQSPRTQPKGTYVISASGGVVTVQGSN